MAHHERQQEMIRKRKQATTEAFSCTSSLTPCVVSAKRKTSVCIKLHEGASGVGQLSCRAPFNASFLPLFGETTVYQAAVGSLFPAFCDKGPQRDHRGTTEGTHGDRGARPCLTLCFVLGNMWTFLRQGAPRSQICGLHKGKITHCKR